MWTFCDHNRRHYHYLRNRLPSDWSSDRLTGPITHISNQMIEDQAEGFMTP